MLDRYRNQTGIINIDEYDYLKITIVGCGSIGSFLALALNKLGFKNLLLIDDDKVEDHNISTQFYLNKDKGQHKIRALANSLSGNIRQGNNIKGIATKVRGNNKIKSDVVFVCVDSLVQRKIILKAILDSFEKYGKPRVMIDGRMHRLLFRVYTIDLKDTDLVKKYTTTLLGSEFKGTCTEKGIIQNVFAVVAVMVEQLKKLIKGQKYSAIINADFENYLFNKQANKGE